MGFELTAKQHAVLEMIGNAPTTYIDENGLEQQHKALGWT
ncbi:hypothetical protein AGMMS49543_27490 [Betaproteobacteria bacterium]|nr:hypothetical protein AGMMS49543_27490 [Betaproteobacteria bacterium]